MCALRVHISKIHIYLLVYIDKIVQWSGLQLKSMISIKKRLSLSSKMMFLVVSHFPCFRCSPNSQPHNWYWYLAAKISQGLHWCPEDFSTDNNNLSIDALKIFSTDNNNLEPDHGFFVDRPKTTSLFLAELTKTYLHARPFPCYA